MFKLLLVIQKYLISAILQCNEYAITPSHRRLTSKSIITDIQSPSYELQLTKDHEPNCSISSKRQPCVPNMLFGFCCFGVTYYLLPLIRQGWKQGALATRQREWSGTHQWVPKIDILEEVLAKWNWVSNKNGGTNDIHQLYYDITAQIHTHTYYKIKNTAHSKCMF